MIALANEAVFCTQCLDSNEPPNDSKRMHLTEKVVRKNISIPLIYTHRFTAITGIKNFVTTVCCRIFTDILQQVLPSSSSSSFVNGIPVPPTIHGFPHPTFGGINGMPDVVVGDCLPNNNIFVGDIPVFPGNNSFVGDFSLFSNDNIFTGGNLPIFPKNNLFVEENVPILPNNDLFIVPNGVWGWNPNYIATQNDRTLFLTFSRGFPVTKDEVKQLFTRLYGEKCIEGIFMGENNNKHGSNTNGNSNDQQILFARVVLDSVATVDRILSGESVKKFRIHGKHIWARKYE